MTISNSQTLPERPAFAGWLGQANDITQQFLAFSGRADVISLAGGLPAAELYPIAAIRDATARALVRHGPAALEYGPVAGLPELRALIAARIGAETGGRFTADNVIITSGSMQALSLLGLVLIDPGCGIIAQAPTYLGALDAWRPRLPTYTALDWSPPEGPEALAAYRTAKFAYAVPNYSNPTGHLVSQAHRAALLDRVLQTGTWLVEDDPYRSLTLDGPTGRSILSHACDHIHGPIYDGPVIYLGTVSKSLVPGLRCGWVVAAPDMIRTLAMAKQSTDMSGSMLTQAITLDLLETGFDVAHADTMIATYRARRDALCAELDLRLSPWFTWTMPAGGMFVWLRARHDAIDTNDLYRFAVDEKIAFVPGSVFDFTGQDRFTMRLNFTRSAPEVIREGIARLERAVHRYRAHQNRPSDGHL